jgi:hypothetical protein
MGKAKSVASRASRASRATSVRSTAVKNRKASPVDSGKRNQQTKLVECKACFQNIKPGEKLTTCGLMLSQCNKNNKSFYYKLKAKSELADVWKRFAGEQPERARALRPKFVATGQWSEVVDCVRQFSKSEIFGDKVGQVKRNELSFTRHFLTAGLGPKQVNRMWKKGVDEKGNRLQVALDEKGDTVLLMDLDEIITRTQRREDRTTATTTKAKPVRGEEARLLMGVCENSGFSNKRKHRAVHEDTSLDDGVSSEHDSQGSVDFEEEDDSVIDESDDQMAPRAKVRKLEVKPRTCLIEPDEKGFNDSAPITSRRLDNSSVKKARQERRMSTASTASPSKLDGPSDSEDVAFEPFHSLSTKLPTLSELQKMPMNEVRAAIAAAPAQFDTSASFWNMQLHIDAYVEAVVSSRRVGEEGLEDF